MLVAVGLLLTSVVACGGPGASTPTPGSVGQLQVALFGRSLTNFVPYMLASKLGYFKDQGLAVTLLETQSSAETDQAILTGAAGLAFGGPNEPYKAQLNGVSARVAMATTSGPLNSIVVQPDMVIQRGVVSVLRGKSIGVPGLGGGGDANLRFWLKDGGLDPQRDVKIVNIGGGGQGLIAAMQARRVDAILSFQPFTAILINQQHAGKYLLNPVDGDGPAVMQPGHIPWSVVWGTDQYVLAHVSQVRAFVRALSRALSTIRDDPTRGLDLTAELYPELDRNTVLLPLLKELAKVADTSVPASDMDAVNAWLQALGILKASESIAYQKYVFAQFSSDWTKSSKTVVTK